MLFRALILVLSLGLSQARAESYGSFRVVKGDIKVKSAKNGSISVAKVGQKVFPKDTITAGKDSRAKIVMVDNNEINVSPETEIIFQNYETKSEDGKKNVLLNVLYGKVRAKVNEKYEGRKDSQFQIKTPTAVAGVRGTDFITGFDKLGAKSEILTFEGKVTAQAVLPNGTLSAPVFVAAGQVLNNISSEAKLEVKAASPSQLAAADSSSDAEKTGGGESDKRQPSSDDKKSDKSTEKENKDEKPKISDNKDAKSEDKVNSDNKERSGKESDSTQKSENPKAGPTESNSRAPSSTTGPSSGGALPSGGGAMITDKDLPTTPNNVNLPIAGPAFDPGIPFTPVGGAVPVFVPPSQDFINGAIQNGNSQVNIRIINN